VLPRTCAALATAVVVFVAGSSVAAPAVDRASRNVVTRLPTLDAAIVAEINAARAEHGLARLRFSRPLRAAAASHTYDMARHGYFSHASRDGTSCFARMSRFYRSSGRRELGETLLWYDGAVDAASIVHEWLTSPEHRAILLDPGCRELGIAAVHATAASGAFNGEITLVTADFGAR
jgi:uncharacterized protein YkwD